MKPEALEAFVADPANGLCQVQNIHNLQVRVTLQPTDLLALRSMPNNLTPHILDSLRVRNANSAYFILSFSRNGHEVLQPSEGFAAYSDLLQKLAFHMEDNVRLITAGGDTLRPTTAYLDRTYASATSSQLLFGFAPPPASTGWKFHVSEFGLGTGDMSFEFPHEIITSAPTLSLD